MTYDQAVTYAQEAGIPDERIDGVLEDTPICGKCGDEGPCNDEVYYLIDKEVKRLRYHGFIPEIEQ